jgi:hypothetical protein
MAFILKYPHQEADHQFGFGGTMIVIIFVKECPQCIHHPVLAMAVPYSGRILFNEAISVKLVHV